MQSHQDDHELLLHQTSQNKEIPVEELSGDQGMEKTIMVTFTHQSKANLFESSTTVIKVIIGSGIISLPYTVSVMGWALSIILFSVIGLANQYTCVILLKAKNLSRHSTYNSIAYYLYSSKVCIFLLSFLNVFANVGFRMSFLLQIVVAMLSILKSAVRKLFVEFIGEDSQAVGQFYTSETFIAIAVSVLLVPTILVQRIEKLKILSVIGFFAVVLAIVSLFAIFFVEMGERNWENSFTMLAFPQDALAVLSVFPNIMFALVFQSNFFSIYKGLTKATDKRMQVASGTAIGFSTILYIILGVMGYCLYGSEDQYVDANFLLEINQQNTNVILYVGIYVGFLLSGILCIPVTFMVARNNLIVIIKLFKQQSPSINQKTSKRQYSALQEIGSFTTGETKEQVKKKAKIRFYIYTLTLYAVYVFITIMVTSLAAVFNIVGAIASSAISLIVPYMFYVFLVRRKNKPKTVHYFLSLAGVVVFVPLGILSVVSLYI